MDTEEKKTGISAGNNGGSGESAGENKKNGGRNHHGYRGKGHRPEKRGEQNTANPGTNPQKQPVPAENPAQTAPAGSKQRSDGNRNGNRRGKKRGANHQRPRDNSLAEADEALEELREQKQLRSEQKKRPEQKKQNDQKKQKEQKQPKPEPVEAEENPLADYTGTRPFTRTQLSVSREYDMELDRMPKDPTLDAVFGESVPDTMPAEGTEVVGVHFPQGGKVYWFDPAGISFTEGNKVIVETARGTEMGEVALGNRLVPSESIVPPLRPVIRLATDADKEHEADNARRCVGALKICAGKVEKHNLGMKLVGAQYTFDNAKLIFYFTAASRVDFRELVKDLASEFRTRIELRQIGIRDEAKMLGGRGICGRKLCCSSFLPNYAQVSVKMAKEQGLSLNSSKISGNCGRLMCCLKYEQSTYDRELEAMPAPESVVDTPDGRGTVTEVKPISYAVKVKLDEKPDQPPRQYQLSDIKVIRKVAYRHDDTPDTDEEIN